MADSTSKEKNKLIISDTGIGIPTDRQHDLTNPFSRADVNPHMASEGWGLGLAITKSLIDLHDGTLVIKSKVGEGTTIEVALPL
ncbi:ATP-binding protein [Rhodospirillales bacterium]|nr:ATP-binding protein [Rhodospirillales bacterium]